MAASAWFRPDYFSDHAHSAAAWDATFTDERPPGTPEALPSSMKCWLDHTGPGKIRLGQHIGFDDRNKGPWFTRSSGWWSTRAPLRWRPTATKASTILPFAQIPLDRFASWSCAVRALPRASPPIWPPRCARVDPSIPIYDVKTMEQRSTIR